MASLTVVVLSTLLAGTMGATSYDYYESNIETELGHCTADGEHVTAELSWFKGVAITIFVVTVGIFGFVLGRWKGNYENRRLVSSHIDTESRSKGSQSPCTYKKGRFTPLPDSSHG